MKEVSWFTGLSLSNNLNEMYLPKAATAWATLHDITTGSFSTLDLPIVAETEHLSYFSRKVHPSGADCPFFMELYNSVNVHDVEKSKIIHQNFTQMSNLARNKCHAFAD